VILTVAAWLAALTPAWADTGPSGAPAPAPGPAGDDPVRIGVGVGGELIDILSHDDDNGDEDNGDEDNGDEDGDHNGHGLLGLLLGNGDDDGDEDGDGLLDELVNVVDKVVEALFGEDEDSVDSPAGLSVEAVRPTDDDDGLVPQVLEALEELDLDDIEPLEDVLDLAGDTVNFVAAAGNQVVGTICQVRHFLATGHVIIVLLIIGPVFIPPIGPMPACVP
jgi:hypothetical protein